MRHSIRSKAMALLLTVGMLLAADTKLYAQGLRVEADLTVNDMKYDGGKHFRVHLFRMEAGKTYVIDMIRLANGDPNRTFDPYLRIEDAAGTKILAWDDDSGGDLNASITFKADKTEEYRIVATTFGAGMTGRYRLTATAITAVAAVPAISPSPIPQPGGQAPAPRRTQLDNAIANLRIAIRNDEQNLTAANIGIPVLQLARDEAYRATQDPKRMGFGATTAYIAADALLREGIADRNRIESNLRTNRDRLRQLEEQLRNLRD